MSVKVTTEVAEVEASKTPLDEQGQARTRASLWLLPIAVAPCVPFAVYRGYISVGVAACAVGCSHRIGIFFSCAFPSKQTQILRNLYVF